MKTCKVCDLFEVDYGVNLELNALEKSSNGINFISRTKKNNGISAKVKPIPWISPLPAGTITVAVSGSVMESFLQISPYYTGWHIYCLTPKYPMNNSIKLFYCHCLRMNKFRYSYGRQANATLAELQIPALDSIPEFVKQFSIRDYAENMLRGADFPTLQYEKRTNERTVPLEDLFDVRNGIASSQVERSRTKRSKNWIPYVRPSYRQETSIDAYVNKNLIPENVIFPKQTLYVSTDGQGSHTYSYVSTFEFVPNSNVSVLIPKRPMEIQEKIFYAHCITMNRYRFSYGRKPKGDRLKEILLPEYPPRHVIEFDVNMLIQSFQSVLDYVQ